MTKLKYLLVLAAFGLLMPSTMLADDHAPATTEMASESADHAATPDTMKHEEKKHDSAAKSDDSKKEESHEKMGFMDKVKSWFK